MPTSFSKETKPTTTFTKQRITDFLLKQDSFYLLLQTGDKIILTNGATNFTKETKPS